MRLRDEWRVSIARILDLDHHRLLHGPDRSDWRGGRCPGITATRAPMVRAPGRDARTALLAGLGALEHRSLRSVSRVLPRLSLAVRTWRQVASFRQLALASAAHAPRPEGRSRPRMASYRPVRRTTRNGPDRDFHLKACPPRGAQQRPPLPGLRRPGPPHVALEARRSPTRFSGAASRPTRAVRPASALACSVSCCRTASIQVRARLLPDWPARADEVRVGI